jgi:hypothetical protein
VLRGIGADPLATGGDCAVLRAAGTR